MPCNSPNKVFYVGVKPNGKKEILFTSRNAKYAFRNIGSETWAVSTDDYVAGSMLPGLEVVTDCDLVPCGQCIGCRLDYARSWAARMMMERKLYPYDQCWFVTFTYDDEHLPPPREVIDQETGEIRKSQFRSVSKRTHQLLMKKIRKHYGDGIRFFMSGEYGDISFRPHYHYVLFGIQFEDLVLHSNNFRGDALYTSDRLVRTCWSDDNGTPLGFVSIGHVDFDSCNYVARYTLKKQKMIDSTAYEQLGIDPEFCLMSRNPGIGKEYFEKHYEIIYETDEVILSGYDGAFVVKPPRYYDGLLERIDPDKLNAIKDDRRLRADNADQLTGVLRPGLDIEDIYSAKERKLKNKVIFKKKSEV